MPRYLMLTSSKNWLLKQFRTCFLDQSGPIQNEWDAKRNSPGFLSKLGRHLVLSKFVS